MNSIYKQLNLVNSIVFVLLLTAGVQSQRQNHETQVQPTSAAAGQVNNGAYQGNNNEIVGNPKGYIFEYAFAMSHDHPQQAAHQGQHLYANNQQQQPQPQHSGQGGQVYQQQQQQQHQQQPLYQPAANYQPVQFSYYRSFNPEASNLQGQTVQYKNDRFLSEDTRKRLEDFFKNAPTYEQTNYDSDGKQQTDQNLTPSSTNIDKKQTTINYQMPHYAAAPIPPPSSYYQNPYIPYHRLHMAPVAPPVPPSPPPMPYYDHNEYEKSNAPNFQQLLADGKQRKGKLVKVKVGKENEEGKPWGVKTTYQYRDPKSPNNYMEFTEMKVEMKNNKGNGPVAAASEFHETSNKTVAN